MVKIKETEYKSTCDFVHVNKLKGKANELFGKDWEPEDDQLQIEQLLEYVGADFFDVRYNEEGDYFNVEFNEDRQRVSILEEKLKAIKEGKIKFYQITKENFLSYYFDTGDDGGQREMRACIGRDAVQSLRDKGEFTLDVKTLFEGCEQECIRVSYLENCEVEDGEIMDLDHECEVILID